MIELPAGVELRQAGSVTAVLSVQTSSGNTRYTRIPVQALGGC